MWHGQYLAALAAQEEAHDTQTATMKEQLAQLQAACTRQLAALDTLQTQVHLYSTAHLGTQAHIWCGTALSWIVALCLRDVKCSTWLPLQEEHGGLAADQANIASLCSDWQTAGTNCIDEQLKVRIHDSNSITTSCMCLKHPHSCAAHCCNSLCMPAFAGSVRAPGGAPAAACRVRRAVPCAAHRASSSDGHLPYCSTRWRSV